MFKNPAFLTISGLPPMPKSFWKFSMFTRPANRSVVCYASAHNLEGTDVRWVHAILEKWLTWKLT